MDRRAAGALLALAACIACSAAAPTASNQTALDLYEGATEGCYYNFQHYGEGDRIMTNEPCLNCTCHNRMLMCYLRVCPFTKAIGQDCTVEKRADQCCPIVTCPDVPVDLLTSTSTTSPAEYGTTGLGKPDKYGCSISGKYFPEGSKVPPTPNKPCEHCYCIRNMTTCVMQECTLHVDGCTPIYHKDVCCPVRYSCDHPEDEVPLLDDMSTTVRPTPGFLLTTTTISPVTQMTQDCVHDDQVFSDGALIKTEKACEHCYCMKGDIVCVVQECGAPMENEGKNCTSLPPREGQCCPDTYICEGDDLTSDRPTEPTTESILEKLTTLLPPRRTSVEGSGYRNEPDETPYTETSSIGSEMEGSGEEQETSKPFETDEIIPTPGDADEDQYIYVTTKAPTHEEHEQTTAEIDKNMIPDQKDKTVEPHVYLSTTNAPVSEEIEKLTTIGMTEEEILEQNKYVPATRAPESVTTELGDSQNTVPDVIPDEEFSKPYEYTPSTTTAPTSEKSESPIDGEDDKLTSSEKEQDITMGAHSETSKPDYNIPSSSTLDEIEKETAAPTEIPNVTPETMVEKEYTIGDITRTTSTTSLEESSLSEEENKSSKPEQLAPSTTSSPTEEDKESTKPSQVALDTTSSPDDEDKDSSKPEQLAPSTVNLLEEGEKFTTEPDHAQNTVAVADKESTYPHSDIQTTTISLLPVGEESTTVFNEEQVVTDKTIKDILIPHEDITTAAPAVKETEFTTAEPDRGLNTIPNEIIEETSSEPSLPERTTLSEETKGTEPSIITDKLQTQIDIKSTPAFELTTLLPDSIITKGDQFTITTEPSFRKEDKGTVSTEKPKEIEPTTVKLEFVDEGLIPTSSHDDKAGTSSDVPTEEEDFTTSVPEYITEVTEVAETIGSKQTTTESAKEPEIVSEPSSEQDSDLRPSTEKATEITPFIETHEEPSRIPGEGDCLLNGVTYRNNTVVPSTNNCHTGCRCASSIIKCDPIICSPPPDYMDNCQSIYDSPDSCCPTFVCDHQKETVPPQSDNQMSGTESPLPSPTIECRGDQCEISVPTKQPTGPSELCPSGSCLTEGDHKTECGSEGCGDALQKPNESTSSVEQTENCTNGKCKPEDCTNSECQLPQTQVSPVKPCEGEHCEETDKVIPESPQLCKNGEDCKTLEISSQATPCQGESCNKIDCGDGVCDSDVVASPPDNQLESCKNEGGCKPQDIPVPDCTGDESCRRKEISASDEKLPTICEGSNCLHEKETTVTEGFVELSTELSKTEQIPSEEVTEKTVPTEEDKATETPESLTPNPEDEKDRKETDTYTTEGQTDKAITNADIQDIIVTEDEATKKPTPLDEKDTKTPATIDDEDKEKLTIEIGITEKPTMIEKQGTETSDVIQEGITKPTMLGEEEGKEKPTVVKEKATETPIIVEDIGTEAPILVGEEDTEKPALTDEDKKEKPIMIDEESTKKPAVIKDDDTVKPAINEEEAPTISEIAKEESSDKPTITENKDTDAPVIFGQSSTEIPAVVTDVNTEKLSLTDEESKDITEKPNIADDGTEQTIIVNEEGKDKSTDIDVRVTDKPATIDDKEIDTPIEESGMAKPDLVETEGTEIPTVEKEVTKSSDIIKEETTTKAVVTDEDEKEKPSDGEEEIKEKPTDSTEVPALIDGDGKEKPAIIDEKGTEKPIVQEDDKKEPTAVEQESTENIVTIESQTEKSETEEEDKLKPTIASEESTAKPDLSDKEKSSESPSIIITEGTEGPAIVDKDTETPSLVDKEDQEEPAIPEMESAKKPIDIERESTELPSIGEENTEKPVVSDEEDIKKPSVVKEEGTMKPFITEEEITAAPDITEEKGTAKPAIIDERTEEPTTIEKEGPTKPITGEEDTEKPTIIDEETKQKPDKADQDDTNKPAIAEEGTDTPSIIEEGTEKPALSDENVKVKPVDEEDAKKPILGEEKDQQKPVEHEEGEKDKPSISDEEIKDKPAVDKVDVTEEPGVHEEEGSGTEIPEAPHTTELEKEVKLPEITIQPTEAAVTEIEKETKTPYYELQTTKVEDIVHEYTTESNIVEPIVKQDIPEEPQDGGNKVAVIHDHSRTPEITTESLSEQELTTKTSVPEQEKVTISDQHVEVTTSKDTADIKEEGSTVSQDLTSEEAAWSTKAPESHETSEPVEKTTETGLISEQEEVSTDTSEIESPTTKAPGAGPIIIEPQEGIEPELHVTSKTEEESTTKVYEENKIKPIPESHVTEASSTLPEYETSVQVTDVSVMTDKDKSKTEVHELHGTEPDEITTQLPISEIKTDHPAIYRPEKEETVTETETSGYSVTEPVRRITEIEDSFVTGQEDMATGYPDHHVPSATDKIDESVDVSITSSEKPLIIDMESLGLPEKSSESDKPITMMPGQDYQTPVTEKGKPTDEFELPTTEISIPVVTELKDIPHVPEKDVIGYEEKATTILDLSGQTPAEGYTEQQKPGTEMPQYVTTTEKQFKTTGLYVTEPQESSTKSVEQEITDVQTITSDLSKTSEKEGEAETIAPQIMHTETTSDVDKKEPSFTEIQKLSTELPISLEDIHTELPDVQVSSEVPQSLVTEQKESLGEQTTVSSIPKEESSYKPELQTTQSEEISKAPGVHISDQEEIQTEAPVHITEPVEVSTKKTEQEDKMTQVSEESVTEKLDTATTLRESPPVTEAIEELGVTKSTERTSAQTEVSETTPYLIELQEHTHKIIEDMTTVSSYKPMEDISTSSPSEEEQTYKPVEDTSTSSPSEDEQPYKPVEDISTSSPSDEEHSYKPVDAISTSAPFEKVHPYKPVDVSTSLPSEEEYPHKPVEDISTLAPSEEEHSYKPVEDISTSSPSDEEHSYKPVDDISTSAPSEEEHSHKPVEDISTSSPLAEEYTPKIEELTPTVPPFEKPTTVHPETEQEPQVSELTTKRVDAEIETATEETEATTKSSEEPLPEDVSEKTSELVPVEEITPAVIQGEDNKYAADHKEYTSAPTQIIQESTPAVVTESEKLPTTETDITVPSEKEISTSEKPLHPIVSQETTAPEEEFIFSTTKATTVRQAEDIVTSVSDDKFGRPEERPSETSEVPPSSTTTEVSKPGISDLQPTDEISVPDEDGHFPSSGTSGYGEPDYVEEDQAFGPGTCRYGGKMYVSAQQIPRDDPCDFCFCFRSDIICLQQSCPPPIHGCHEEPIQGFCCPRYECPVSMATTVNVTTTTTTTTTTLPPHFPTHSYKGAAQRRGCQIKGHTYKVGEVVRSSSGPCLHCTCGGDGQMKCDPKACTPEPMLRQMIAAAVSAKRRR